MSNRGFTLIEVLVASAIFVGVMVIGVSSFSNINHVNEQITQTRTLSQTGNFVMEALARDIRSATGVKDPTSGTFGIDFPFDFVRNDVPISTLDVDGEITAPSLTTRKAGTNSCNVVSPITRNFALVAIPDTQYFDLQVKDGTCAPASLLPGTIRIVQLSFKGVSHQASSTVQPFVAISFTLVDTAARDTSLPSAQQTFGTTVTNLTYAGQ